MPSSREKPEDITERLCRAADGAVWVRFDPTHHLLFVGHERADGWWVHTLDTYNGNEYDAPWPVAPEHVAAVGYREAFAAAVSERINRGY